MAHGNTQKIKCNGYDDTLIITEDSMQRECDNYPVMRRWEEPLMRRHAEIVCRNGGDILEIGYGMGLSAQAIQEQPNITSHTIIEPEEIILKDLYKFQDKHDNVMVIEGKWADAYDDSLLFDRYDGVFYDAEYDNSFFRWPKIIEYLMKPNGIFSFYNCPIHTRQMSFPVVSSELKESQWLTDYEYYFRKNFDREYEDFKFKDFPEYTPHDRRSINPHFPVDECQIPIYKFRSK